MAGAVSRGIHWYCHVFSDLIWKIWEEEVFLYNPHTGETHILNDSSWRLLQQCAERPCSEAQLVACLEAGEAEEPELPIAVNHLLNHLYRLGLIVAQPGT